MRTRSVLLLVLGFVIASGLLNLHRASAAGLDITTKKLAADRQATPAFYPRSVATATCSDVLICPLGGAAGAPSNGDTVTLVFNTVLQQSTMCSAWTSNTTNRSATVTATISNNAGATGSDVLTVPTISGVTCSGGFKFGSIDLGSSGYVTSNISYTNTDFNLTNAGSNPQIVLKFRSGSTGSTVSSSIITYNCNGELTSSTGKACGKNTAVSAAVRQF